MQYTAFNRSYNIFVTIFGWVQLASRDHTFSQSARSSQDHPVIKPPSTPVLPASRVQRTHRPNPSASSTWQPPSKETSQPETSLTFPAVMHVIDSCRFKETRTCEHFSKACDGYLARCFLGPSRLGVDAQFGPRAQGRPLLIPV